jgi:hypothetical protein
MYKATHCVWLRTIVEYWLVKDINDTWHQGLQEKSCKAKQDCFRAPGQTETSLKIENLRYNKTTGKLL